MDADLCRQAGVVMPENDGMVNWKRGYAIPLWDRQVFFLACEGRRSMPVFVAAFRLFPLLLNKSFMHIGRRAGKDVFERW